MLLNYFHFCGIQVQLLHQERNPLPAKSRAFTVFQSMTNIQSFVLLKKPVCSLLSLITLHKRLS